MYANLYYLKKIVIYVSIVLSICLLYGCNNNSSGQNLADNEKIIISVTDIYINKKYGYSFEIPTNWHEKVKVIEHEASASFVYTGLDNKYFHIFTITAWSLKEFDELKAKDDGYFSDNDIVGVIDKYVFILSLPLDLPFADQNEYETYYKDYKGVSLSYPEIKERFKSIKS